MNADEMENLTTNGSAGDVKVLLSMYGTHTFIDGGGKCIDLIAECVLATENDRAEKLSLVYDYVNKRGAFGNPLELTPDFAAQLQETVAQLTRITVAMAREITELREELAEKKPAEPQRKPLIRALVV